MILRFYGFYVSTVVPLNPYSLKTKKHCLQSSPLYRNSRRDCRTVESPIPSGACESTVSQITVEKTVDTVKLNSLGRRDHHSPCFSYPGPPPSTSHQFGVEHGGAPCFRGSLHVAPRYPLRIVGVIRPGIDALVFCT